MASGQKKSKLLVICNVIAIVFVVAISLLSLLSIEMLGANRILNFDKVYHFIAFFCLAFPLSLVQPTRIIWVFLGVMAFGGSIELIQSFMDRQASLADIVANGTGATAGVVMASKLGNWL